MSWEAGVAARWRLRPWWVLSVAVLAAPLAGLVAGVWLPATSAVLVAISPRSIGQGLRSAADRGSRTGLCVFSRGTGRA
jgi:hypothetical protein